MFGLSVYKVGGELPARDDLTEGLREFRFNRGRNEARKRVSFLGPRTIASGDTQVLYVAGKELFRDEAKRLIVENERIVEQISSVRREVYSRVFVCYSNNGARNGKVFVQFISEYRKVPRRYLLAALSLAVTGDLPQDRGAEGDNDGNDGGDQGGGGAGGDGDDREDDEEGDGAPDNAPGILTVRYNVDCVAQHFPQNIWDENFHRPGRVQRGRIAGRQVDRDPAAAQLRQGKTYVGVEIPIQNSVQKARVYDRGSITFMGLKSEDFHTAANERAAIGKILQIVESLRPCEV